MARTWPKSKLTFMHNGKSSNQNLNLMKRKNWCKEIIVSDSGPMTRHENTCTSFFLSE